MDRGNLKVRKAVFPAAGCGTRFLPITKAIPKEMLPLVDKPLIQYGVEEAVASGLEEIIVITGRGKQAIEDHFDTSVELESFLKEKGRRGILKEIQRLSDLAHLTYTRQKKPLGLGHAILCVKSLVGNEPFTVILGDDIIDSTVPVMKQMVDCFKGYPYSILAVERVAQEDVHRYGVIKGEKIEDGIYRVLELVEKPLPKDAPSNLAIIGRYILTPRIFNALEVTEPGKGNEIQLTDGISNLLKEEPVYALEFKGKRYDAGDKLGFLKANLVFALKRKEIRNELRVFLKELEKGKYSGVG